MGGWKSMTGKLCDTRRWCKYADGGRGKAKSARIAMRSPRGILDENHETMQEDISNWC